MGGVYEADRSCRRAGGALKVPRVSEACKTRISLDEGLLRWPRLGNRIVFGDCVRCQTNIYIYGFCTFPTVVVTILKKKTASAS